MHNGFEKWEQSVVYWSPKDEVRAVLFEFWVQFTNLEYLISLRKWKVITGFVVYSRVHGHASRHVIVHQELIIVMITTMMMEWVPAVSRSFTSYAINPLGMLGHSLPCLIIHSHLITRLATHAVSNMHTNMLSFTGFEQIHLFTTHSVALTLYIFQ